MAPGRTPQSSAPLRAAPLRPLAFVPQARGRAGPHSAPCHIPGHRRDLSGPVTRLALPGLRSSPPRFTLGRGKARASPGLCGPLPPRPPAGGCMAGDPCCDRPPCPPSRGGVGAVARSVHGHRPAFLAFGPHPHATPGPPGDLPGHYLLAITRRLLRLDLRMLLLILLFRFCF